MVPQALVAARLGGGRRRRGSRALRRGRRRRSRLLSVFVGIVPAHPLDKGQGAQGAHRHHHRRHRLEPPDARPALPVGHVEVEEEDAQVGQDGKGIAQLDQANPLRVLPRELGDHGQVAHLHRRPPHVEQRGTHRKVQHAVRGVRPLEGAERKDAHEARQGQHRAHNVPQHPPPNPFRGVAWGGVRQQASHGRGQGVENLSAKHDDARVQARQGAHAFLVGLVWVGEVDGLDWMGGIDHDRQHTRTRYTSK